MGMAGCCMSSVTAMYEGLCYSWIFVLQLLQVCVGAVIVVDLGVCLVCVGGGSSVL